MANAKAKVALELLLVDLELTGVPEKALLKSRNLLSVDLIWPRFGVARKSSARQVVLTKGKAKFSSEPWANRVMHREEVDGHMAVAVTVTEPLTTQRIHRFLQLIAKYALKEGSDIVAASVAGYGDLAAAPLDALATMVGEKSSPRAIAQGVLDISDLPSPGEERLIEVPLTRPHFNRPIGKLRFLLKA